MKAISIKEPWASLIRNGEKGLGGNGNV